jgi:hypothetical protein
MSKVSISEAARLTGKPRSTLHRHIGNGTLSKESDGQGKPVLDIAELERVYGPLLQADMKHNGVMLHSATSETVAANRAEIEGLRRENTLLRDQLEDVKRERQKWQEEADSWRKQATALLPGPTAANQQQPEPKSAEPAQAQRSAAEPVTPHKGLRGWLHRLTG